MGRAGNEKDMHVQETFSEHALVTTNNKYVEIPQVLVITLGDDGTVGTRNSGMVMICTVSQWVKIITNQKAFFSLQPCYNKLYHFLAFAFTCAKLEMVRQNKTITSD